MVKGETLLVGGYDGRVAGADEAETDDARSSNVTVLPAGRDSGQTRWRNGPRRRLVFREVVEIDVTVLVANSDEGVVIG